MALKIPFVIGRPVLISSHSQPVAREASSGELRRLRVDYAQPPAASVR